MTSKTDVRYKRILVKLSGEALMGSTDYGIDPKVLKRIALEIQELLGLGVQVAVVIGGGNIFRGEGLARSGMDRVTGDHMGMLAPSSPPIRRHRCAPSRSAPSCSSRRPRSTASTRLIR